jgi:hypothetical protein
MKPSTRPKKIMGRDQYGRAYHDLGAHPRKALLDRLVRKHAAKIYIDKEEGPPVHIGYIIAGLWITLYQIEPWEREA